MDPLLVFDLVALGVTGLLVACGSALVGATLRRSAVHPRRTWIARLVAGAGREVVALWLVAFLLGLLAPILLRILAVRASLKTNRAR